jgi:hypothetical protein
VFSLVGRRGPHPASSLPEGRGAGACAGSCGDLSVLEDQITIRKRDRNPRELLGESERALFFGAPGSPRASGRRDG